MANYTMCPCCGRSIQVDRKVKEKQISLWKSKFETNALERGGDVWTYRMLGRQPGSKEPIHERDPAPRGLVREVTAELRRRCQAFLDRRRSSS